MCSNSNNNLPIIRFTNCQILRDHKIISEDLWVRNGKIINPEPIYYLEKRLADIVIDCNNRLIAPGYIDLQINGHFGYDFSNCDIDIEEAVHKTALGLVKHGVTAFCPTLVTQSRDSYHKILPQIKRTAGSKSYGSTNLGAHVEGPFISPSKKGAHPIDYIKPIGSYANIQDMYKHMDNISIITLAPELDPSGEIVRQLVKSGITVSVGHSMATLEEGERGINAGATFITHLFNAMLPFHHRDPGLVGLLTSTGITKQIYYGIIADGIHTHYAALKIAFKSNPKGMVLVSDAISAAGLGVGRHKLGIQDIEIKDNNKAFISGTDTLCGSIAALDYCVRHLRQVTGCSTVEAIECATLHAAQVMNMADRKGTLAFGADADFNILDDKLNVLATFISGQCVHKNDETLDITI
ncbi:N-acetylglucosamine-6-phosphate deacetylase-like [Oppia nitens]|uniref:N-acetylglucosamine-6-phosphate deacetylase-like n=1 Tax=Oppia nitens TaxID=1686743 RepID=UPI0023DCD864|nr:N-acetylglucosamine-6-phosphate deacetylase-like [Oppia nitens]XP_054156713.1 N-acetylglucosamine-6-phosphate deacetylase-like [Oppia nitens]